MNIIAFNLTQTFQMHSFNCAVTEVVAQFAVKQRTEKLDEDSAIVDQHRLSMNLNVHFDKHLDSVQMADVQPFPASCMEGPQWALAAVFISAQDRGRKKQ